MELRAPGIETTTRQGWSSRRRQRGVRRVVGVGMGLLRHDCHDGEDEGVDAVLELGIRGRARYAQAHVCPKTMKPPSCSTSASGLAVAT